MPGHHNNDRYVHGSSSSSSTEENNDDDVTMSSPSLNVVEEATTLTSSSTISATPSTTTIPFTIPATKTLLLLHHDHQQRQGKMYDQTKDLMDALPPEILDQLLLSFDKPTLLHCVVLSKRWSRRAMPHLWYRPWMMYYISWMRLLQTVSCSVGVVRGGENAEVVGKVGKRMAVGGSNPQPVGLGMSQQQDQDQDQEEEQQQDHAGVGNGIITTTTTIRTTIAPMVADPQTTQDKESTTTTITSPPRPTRFAHDYGGLIKILDFSTLYYIVSDQLLFHLLSQTPSLSQLIIDDPKQFSDESLFTIAKHCLNLVRLELRRCLKVSDKGMEAVFGRCLKLKRLVLSNVVGDAGDGGGRVGHSSKASSSNHSLTLTHKTLDHLAITTTTTTPSKDSYSTTPRKLHTLNLANGLRFPTYGELDPASSLSLSNLLNTYASTLVSLNLSFCGPAVTDTLLSQFSTSSYTSSFLPLQHLNIAFCFEVTDTGLVALLTQGCPDLQDLDITGVTQVSDKSILAIGKSCRRFRQLVMVDERHRTNPGGATVGSGGGGGGGGGGQWSSQNPLITDEVLNRFPWGVRIVQRREELHGQRRSPRIF